MNQTEIKRKQIFIIVFFPVLIGLKWLLGLAKGNESGYFIINLQLCMFPVGCFMIFFPQVVEKLIRSRMSKGQYKNADRVWKGAKIYGIVIGILSTIILYALSGVLANYVFEVPNGLLGLRFLIPAICFLSFSFVLKGYFQGMGSAMPTVISDIVFFLCSGFFAFLIVSRLKDYGLKVANLLQNSDFEAMYSNVGASLGITLASMVTLLLLIIIFLFADRNNKKYMRDGMRLTEDFSYVLRLLGLSMLPYILVGLCINIPVLTDIVFLRINLNNGLDFVSTYGAVYTDKFLYLILCLLPVLPGIIGFAGKYVTFMKKEEYKHGRDCMHASFVWIFMTAAFISVVLCTLIGKQFQVIGILVFLLSVASFLGFVLWKIGKVWEMVVIFACGGVCHLFVSGISVRMTAGNGDCIMYSFIAQAFLMMVLSGVVLFKNYRGGIAFTRTFLFPLLSVAISGVAMVLIRKFFFAKAENLGAFLPVIFIGAFINIVLLILLKALRMKDMYLIPGGKMIFFIGKRLHLLG